MLEPIWGTDTISKNDLDTCIQGVLDKRIRRSEATKAYKRYIWYICEVGKLYNCY